MGRLIAGINRHQRQALEQRAERQVLEKTEETAHAAFGFFIVADNVRIPRLSSVPELRRRKPKKRSELRRLRADEQMCSFLTMPVSKRALRSRSGETHAHLFFIQTLLNRQQLYPHVSARTQQE